MPEPAIWITPPPRTEGRVAAVKDLFDTRGIRTTYGSIVFAEHVPERTAGAVSRLAEAGWETRGKANLHEFAYGITSQNPHYGAVPNPVAPELTAGGSSGGSAAAVAAGEAGLGLGTDTGGSIRIPAACCGVTGFKPSHGVVGMDGCFPLAPSFDHAGPIGSDVAACAEAMRVLAGIEADPPAALGRLELGVAWLGRAEPPVRERIASVAATLDRVRPVELPLPTGVFPAFQAEIAEVHRDLYPEHRERYGPNVRTKIAQAFELTEAEISAARRAREGFRRDLAAAFDGVDLVIAPTMPILPPHAGSEELEVRARMTELTFPLNAAGAPAIAMPCGWEEGAPVSLQLIGPPGSDALVLGAAALLEDALRHTARPREEREPKH